MVDFLPEATFVINGDSEVIAWNRAMEELTGVPKNEIIGMGDCLYSIPFYGEKRQMLIDYVISHDMTPYDLSENIWKEGDSLNAEIWSSHICNQKGGAYLWVKATGLYDEEGNVVGAVESIQDVTHRKKMETELLNSDEKYLDLIEKTGAIVMKTDMTGNILFINEFGGEKLLGYQKGELINKNVLDTICSGSVENIRIFSDIIEDILENPTCFRITENEYIAWNGEKKWVSWTNSSIMDTEGRPPTGIFAVGTDNTARKQSEIKEKTHIKNLEFISRSAMNFANLQHNEQIYDYISSELISLLPGGLALVNLYDENSGTLHIKSIKGGEIEGYENMLSTMLNQKVLDKNFKISEDYRPYLISNGLMHMPGGMYDLFLKNFSEDVCKTINDVLDLYECYMIGISRDNRLFGSISFAVPNCINDEIRSIIEIFVNQASVVLQRCWYEKELAKNTLIADPEEKEGNAQSKESQKNLRTIFETIKNNHILDVRKQNEVFASVCGKNPNRPVLAIDIKGTIIRANSKISEIIGEGTPIIGKDIEAFIPSDSPFETKDIQQYIANDSKDEHMEISVPFVSQIGEPVNLTWNLEKMFDQTGDVTNILWIGDEYVR
ncbi:PAS domain S-box protein [Methanogenium cariaci]|uniref:PAS domain-containing protein n=1 Tax=Methanogenium cariaci TaxID=2197 RepID=UPI0024806649|nr:PAS domain S-box protein [Methanogenium cariaci]